MQKGADRRKELNTHQAADSSGRMQKTVRRSASTASPETGKPRRTLVDATLALNEGGKRFRTRLVLRCIPQRARPLGACSLVNFCWIGGAADNCGKRLVVIGRPDILQP